MILALFGSLTSIMSYIYNQLVSKSKFCVVKISMSPQGFWNRGWLKLALKKTKSNYSLSTYFISLGVLPI